MDIELFGRYYCEEVASPDRSNEFITSLSAAIMQPRPDFLILDDPQQEERMK